MLLGVTWGWAQMTKPFPGKVDAPICVDTAYRAGDELFVQDVTVSVFNASAREGLAGRTMASSRPRLRRGPDRQRPQGHRLTTPSEIWVDDPDNPGAKLVRARLGQVPVVAHPEVGTPGSPSWSATRSASSGRARSR